MTQEARRVVAVALGSNKGDRRQYLQQAVEALRGVLGDLRTSAFIETAPEGVPSCAPFLNGAAVGWSEERPEVVLRCLQEIERAAGRERPFAGAPRTLDLDLILVGDLIVDAPSLQLPHPRFRQRWFVLEPLASIAPDLRDPVSCRSMRELRDSLGQGAHGAPPAR